MKILDMLDPRNWGQAAYDTAARKPVKAQLLKALTEAKDSATGDLVMRTPGGAIQIPDYDPDALDTRTMGIMNPVVREILAEHLEWSLIRFGQGAQFVRTQDIREIPQLFRAHDVATGMIITNDRMERG